MQRSQFIGLVTLCFLSFTRLLHAESPPAPSSELKARIKTTMGDIEVKLFPDKVPQTVSNFVGLAQKGFYKDILFHRVIPGFMIQTGDPNGDGTGGPGYSFADEIRPELKHDKAGILSMANSGKDTNGSQFFITVAPTPHLDGKHTIFGEVTQGLDIAIAISNVKTNGSKPEKDVKIQTIEILGDGFKPQDVVKIKQYTPDDIKKLTQDPATRMLKKIAEAQANYGAFKSISLIDSRSRGQVLQAYYKADFAQKKNLQIVVIGQLQNNKFAIKQLQFAESEEN
jgi:cyclophilin family peptidyl-prolyl cis-trans isomerase